MAVHEQTFFDREYTLWLEREREIFCMSSQISHGISSVELKINSENSHQCPMSPGLHSLLSFKLDFLKSGNCIKSGNCVVSH